MEEIKIVNIAELRNFSTPMLYVNSDNTGMEDNMSMKEYVAEWSEQAGKVSELEKQFVDAIMNIMKEK